MEIRIRTTGAVVTEQEFRRLYPNTAFPAQLTEQIINDFGGDVVFEGPQATPVEFWQVSVRDGVQQLGGKWYTRYVLGPVFTGTTLPDGTVLTAAQQQAAYVAQKTAERNTALQAAVTTATQLRLDTFAQTRGYAGILSACTYATSPTPKFAKEGQYCVNQRDATWAKLYEILDQVQSGARPVPNSYADVEPELPILVWPA